MRIAFVLGEFPCSSETFVADQINGLLERGHDVHVYADEGHDPRTGRRMELPRPLIARTHHPVPVATSGRVARWLALSGIAMRNGTAAIGVCARALPHGRAAAVTALRFGAVAGFRMEPYDIIHAHFGPNGITAAALRAAGMLSGSLVVSFHGYDVSQFIRASGEDVYTRLFRDADLCLPVTERWARRLIELGCNPAKIEVHAMGVDVERLRPVRRSAGDIEAISVARLVPKKGIDVAIRAAARVLRSRSFRYTIVGDGPEREPLQRLIDELGVSSHVEMVGWRGPADVHEMLGASDVFVLPSVTADNGDEEGLPVALMEAMAAGLPVLSTLHSGIPELVRDGIEGYLVPERDVETLAGRWVELLDNRDLREEMGRAARVRIEDRHDNRALLDRLVVLYRQTARLPEATRDRAVSAGRP